MLSRFYLTRHICEWAYTRLSCYKLFHFFYFLYFVVPLNDEDPIQPMEPNEIGEGNFDGGDEMNAWQFSRKLRKFYESTQTVQSVVDVNNGHNKFYRGL